MKFSHCTIDLETLDTNPTAAITSIAVVMFDLEGNRDQLHVNVDLQSAMDLGMTVKADTIMWWMKQSKAAQDSLINPTPIDITLALNLVKIFIKTRKTSNFCCWTHATFDAPILSYAYDLAGIRSPIHYREHKDIRTLTWLNRRGGEKLERPASLTAHSAIDDALYQADYIANNLQYVLGAVENNS